MISLKDFFSWKANRRFWLNLIAVFVVLLLLMYLSTVVLSLYTHHGEERTVPKVLNLIETQAIEVLEKEDLEAQIVDSIYNPQLPVGTILEQIPAAGTHVKPGRTIYLTVSSKSAPTIKIPDIIDNSSLRQAEAKLRAMGFRLTAPEYIAGEQDWVYGIKRGSISIQTGDKVPYNAILTVVVGNSVMQDSIAEEEYYKQFLTEEDEMEIPTTSNVGEKKTTSPAATTSEKKKTPPPPPNKEHDWF